MRLSSTARIAGAVLALSATLLATAAHANAAPANTDADTDVSTRAAVGKYSKLINKSKQTNYTNQKDEIARCTAQTKGMTCMINKTASATRTIDAGFGLSRGAVAGSLNISQAKTQSVAVTCSSPVKKGHSLVAYPIGTRYKYKIEKHITTPLDYKAGTSGWKHAFNPAPAKVSCKVK